MAVDLSDLGIGIGASFGSGFVCIAISLIIERLGGIGGIVASMPSVVVIDSAGVFLSYYIKNGWLSTSDAVFKFQDAFSAAPIAVLLNMLLLFCWSFFPRVLAKRFPKLSVRRLVGLVTLCSVVPWFLAAIFYHYVIYDPVKKSVGTDATLRKRTSVSCYDTTSELKNCTAFQPELMPSLYANTMAIFLMLAGAIYFSWRPLPAPKGASKPSLCAILFRGFATTLVRSCAHLMRQFPETFSNGLTVIAMMFPIVLIIAVASVTLSSGTAVVSGAVGPLMLGMTSVAVYALVVCLLVPYIPYPAASFCAWLCGVALVNVPGFFYLRWRQRVVQKDWELENTPGSTDATGSNMDQNSSPPSTAADNESEVGNRTGNKPNENCAANKKEKRLDLHAHFEDILISQRTANDYQLESGDTEHRVHVTQNGRTASFHYGPRRHYLPQRANTQHAAGQARRASEFCDASTLSIPGMF